MGGGQCGGGGGAGCPITNPFSYPVAVMLHVSPCIPLGFISLRASSLGGGGREGERGESL